MPPRRRPGKRDTRMDAAIESMAPYGFPTKLVRQTVYDLLKVYGGSDGWVFIEDSSYTLLIDTLLEKEASASASASTHDAGLIEDNPGSGHIEAPPAGCSNKALLPCCKTENLDDASLTNNQAIVSVTAATSETGNHFPIKVEDTVSATTETDNQLPIKAVNPVSATCETDSKPAGNFALGEIHGTPLAISLPLRTMPPKPVEKLCLKRRRPCHGWISDDDEEEELTEVEPPPPSIVSELKY